MFMFYITRSTYLLTEAYQSCILYSFKFTHIHKLTRGLFKYRMQTSIQYNTTYVLEYDDICVFSVYPSGSSNEKLRK